MSWTVPRDAWKGERCFILGGGPSLKEVDIASLRGRGRVIAINCAYLLAPWADMVYFADRDFYKWNRDRLDAYEGDLIVSRHTHPGARHDIKVMKSTKLVPLSRDPAKVGGHDSGSNALNIAFLLGCDPIVLLGFDMRPGNWHDLHEKAQKNDFATKFMPYFHRMAPELERDGVTVLNATPGSALTCFPMVSLDDVLREAA